ncbi:MAG: hypothetical protein IT184_04705 [Acidobacteria bacterium]|nr:hypothetical protein [Acidobacteriota bacterium]
MRRSLFLVTLFAGCLSACGGSSSSDSARPESGASSAQPSSGQAQGSPSVEKGFEQMMQGVQQMADAQGRGGQTKLVDYEVLKGLLPDLSGWERSGAKGQQVSMGISLSSAEAHYAKGDASMKLEIIDTNFSQMVLAPFMMFARAGYEEKSDDGYKKGMTLGGYPGFESWEKGNRDAEVHLLVGDRFMVNVEANGVDNAEPARALAQAVNLSKLAGLK